MSAATPDALSSAPGYSVSPDRPRWSMCAPMTTASSRRAGSDPRIMPMTLRLTTRRSSPLNVSVEVVPARALRLSRLGCRSGLARPGEDRLAGGRGQPHDGDACAVVGLAGKIEHRRRALGARGQRRGERRRFDDDDRPGACGGSQSGLRGESLPPGLRCVTLAQFRTLPFGAGREAGVQQHDLALHVDVPIVVAGRARLADAVAGVHQRRRQRPWRQFGTRGIDAAQVRADIGGLAPPCLDAHLAGRAADLADGHRMEVRRRGVRRALRVSDGTDARKRQLRGDVLGSRFEAAPAEPAALEGR